MRYVIGLIAGFTATLLLSILMVAKTSFGLFPELNVIRMLTEVGAEWIGLPARPFVGWLAHFAVGTVVWGLLFVLLYGRLRGTPPLKGIEFATLAWLGMMFVFMPAAGAAIFGLELGIGAPVATLALHIVYGTVLGWTYGALSRTPAPPRIRNTSGRADSRTIVPGVHR